MLTMPSRSFFMSQYNP
jgi:large subunit ribosomal protein L15